MNSKWLSSIIVHKGASTGRTKYDQDIITQVNKRTDHHDVPRIRNINKITMFLIRGPTKHS